MKKFTIVGILILFFAGCAGPIQMVVKPPHFVVSINSINSGEQVSVERKYYIASGMREVSPEDLQFKEYARYVKRAMLLKGFQFSDSENDADIIVFLGYLSGEPKEHVYSYSTPIWGQTGVSSATTYGTVNTFSPGMASYSGTTTYTPTYGVVGRGTHVGTYNTYIQHIVLNAYDIALYRKTKEEKQLWKTEITGTGPIGDFRRTFPILIAAATKYISEDTKESIKRILTEENKEVLDIKGVVIKSSENPEKTGSQTKK